MKQVVAGVQQLALMPRSAVNAYVIGDVLVDAGMSFSAKRIIAALQGKGTYALVLTHAHADHVGGAAEVCEALRLSLWAGVNDVAAVESGLQVMRPSRWTGLLERALAFDPVAVAKPLREGDGVAGFRVLDVPGHSPGHIALWRASDRALICGDVFLNISLATTAVGLHLPPKLPTIDMAQNIASARILADLEPETVLFGHGPPLHGAAPKLRAFVQGLPGS